MLITRPSHSLNAVKEQHLLIAENFVERTLGDRQIVSDIVHFHGLNALGKEHFCRFVDDSAA